MEYLQDNWGEILLAVVVLANAVVNLTPTPKDNEFLAKILRVVDLFALNLKKK